MAHSSESQGRPIHAAENRTNAELNCQSEDVESSSPQQA